MSVRVADRGEGKLQVLNKSRILLDYTFDRVTSDKTFPKSVRWLLPRDIWREAESADACIDMANAIYVDGRKDLDERRRLQKEARGHLKHLERLIGLAYRKHYIAANQAEYWGKLVAETQQTLGAWMRSDLKRYEEINKQ